MRKVAKSRKKGLVIFQLKKRKFSFDSHESRAWVICLRFKHVGNIDYAIFWKYMFPKSYFILEQNSDSYLFLPRVRSRLEIYMYLWNDLNALILIPALVLMTSITGEILISWVGIVTESAKQLISCGVLFSVNEKHLSQAIRKCHKRVNRAEAL